MRNGRFFIRVTPSGKPVLGSLVERKTAPKSGGRWVDITSAMGLCCAYTAPSSEAPFNFVLSDGAATEIDADWATVSGADTYLLERATDAAFTANLTTVQNTSANSATATGLTTGTVYYFRLSVISNGVAGNYAYASRIAP